MLVSIIIPAPSTNPYLLECLKAISQQSYLDYEIIIILDDIKNTDLSLRGSRRHQAGSRSGGTISKKIKIIQSSAGPAEKRDLGAKNAKGQYLAFLDDDSYPSTNWLKEALNNFNSPNISAVCGPGITPPNDSLLQKVSGAVNESIMGSGPYSYRFLPKKRRFVDDYPSMNFIIKKVDFDKVKGFDTSYWPGEDTKLCLDIVQKLQKKILYDPLVLVYHHRRPIFKKHLQQNGRYGLHRGYFARILPATSFRISYFIPSFFTMGFLLGPFAFFLNKQLFYFYIVIIMIYFLVLLWEATKVWIKEKKVSIAILFIPAVVVTHLWYGVQFLHGYLFTKKLTR